MIESVKYVVNQHTKNIYRILAITRYEVISENRDAYLGALWNIISPLMQIGTYWFVFGLGIRGGEPVNGIPYLQWMLSGLIVWFFISACIRKGTTAISSKMSIIEKIKFPVSILVSTVVLGELVNHLIMIAIAYFIFLIQGYKPDIMNLQLIYYLFCGIAFSISFGLVFSSLNMLARDVKNLINSVMRMLFYVTPILWTMENLPEPIQFLMQCNPIYYIVEGYRESFFPGNLNSIDIYTTIIFWIITLTLFLYGCKLMYKNRFKFVDLA